MNVNNRVHRKRNLINSYKNKMMPNSTSWVQKNDRLLECIQNVETSLNDDEFRDLLQFVDCDCPGQSTAGNYNKLHIKTMVFLLKRSKLFIMKPTRLNADLVDELGFSAGKADIFLRHWTESLKPVLSNLESDGEVNELTDVSWRLDVELVSSGNTLRKTKAPIGALNLQTSTGWTETLDLDHKDLSQLYNTLEDIQSEVDAFKM